MKKIISILCLIVLLTGCLNRVKVKVSEKIGAEISKGAEKYLGCSATEVVKSDVADRVAKLLKAKKKRELLGVKSDKGLVGSLCEVTVGTALPQLIDMGAEKLPESWKCSGEPLKPVLDKIAKEGCAKIKI